MQFYPPLFAATVFLVLFLSAPVLQGQDATDHPTQRTEIVEFFKQYEKATADETAEELMALYDSMAMTDEIIAQAEVNVPPRVRQALAMGMKRQIAQQLQLFGNPWYRHKVVSIKFFGSDDEAEVFVRSWNQNQETTREIFWVLRENNQWRIYDFMDLSMGLTCTKVGALGLKQGMQGGMSVASLNALRSLLRAVVLVGQEDLAGATEAMRSLMGKTTPKFVDSSRWFFAAAVALDEQPAVALQHLDKATAFQPDLPMANYLRSVAYNMLERHELAATSAQHFIDRFGDDADAYHELAVALEAMGKPDQAIAALRKALDDTPNSLLNVEQIGLLLPKQDKSEFAKYFLGLRDHSDSFQYMADTFEMAEDGEVLDVLVKAMAKINPDEPLLDYYRAVVMSTRRQHGQAIQLLQAVIQGISDDDPELDLYEDILLTEAVNADMLLNLYQQTSDPEEFARRAFELVVNRAQYDRGLAMMDAHLQAYPNQPEVHLWAGDLDFYRDQFSAADEHYANGLALQPDDGQVKDTLIYSRALSWHKRGKAVEAYRTLKPQKRYFAELARILVDEQDFPALDQMVALARKDSPNATNVTMLYASQLFDAGQYDRAIQSVTQAQQTNATAKIQDPDRYVRYRSVMDEILIRSYIRTKQYDLAMQATKNAFSKSDRHFYQTLLHAIGGDRQAFESAFQICLDQYGYQERDFIDDDDYPAGFDGLTASEDASSAIGSSVQLRSLAILLSSPQPVDPLTIVNAAEKAWGVTLFSETYRETDDQDDQFVSRLIDDACVVYWNGYRLFIRAETGPYLGDPDLLAEEHEEEFKDDILSHQAWLSVDVDAWPIPEAKEQPDEERAEPKIPGRAQQLVGSLAIELSGEYGTLAINQDSDKMCRLTAEAKKQISGKKPAKAFAEAR